MTIPEIVSKYRDGQSLRKFAADLSKNQPDPISHQTIKNWEAGKKPDYYRMLSIALHNDDWRRKFALDILDELRPDYFSHNDKNRLRRPYQHRVKK